MGVFRKVLWLLLVSAVVCGEGPALAEKRVALVIGNSNYAKVAPLGNPANDAGLMAETFKAAGFDAVDLRRDLNVADMRRALKDFFDKSSGADIAVVFYAGHGIEMDGINYLIPVDAVLDRDVDVYDEALSLDRVLVSVDPAKQLRLVILDACRDNPFTRTMKRTISSRGISRGLAKVEPMSTNTLIAFAAKAGSTASDGDGSNSPFTTALVRHITKPGLDLRKAFGYVRDDVLKATDNRQEPYVYGSLGGDDVPLVPAKPDVVTPQADPQAAVRRDYELAIQLGTRDGWQAFLVQYPDGYYASLAKGQLNKIAAEEARSAEVAAKETVGEKVKAEKLAALPSPSGKAEQPTVDIARALQAELRRVGCNAGTADGDWNAASRKALGLFNESTGMKLDIKAASTDALDAVKSKTGRICPLVCDHGYKADGDTCVKISCKSGYQIGDDNSCEKVESNRKPVIRREAPAEQQKQQAAPSQAPPPSRQAQTTGQVFCNQGGCREIHKGCHIGRQLEGSNWGQREVCP